MRALAFLFPHEIRDEPTGHVSLIALLDGIPYPRGARWLQTSTWVYLDLELAAADLDREVTFEFVCVHPDGEQTILDTRQIRTPAEHPTDDRIPTWSVRHVLPLSPAGPGPHLIQLKADGQLVAERTLHVFTSEG